jgi:uncharacterized protein (TIGR02611 family)
VKKFTFFSEISGSIRVMASIKKTSRKLLVSLAGFPIILLGIILIPLPGPGILVVILGLFILSLEFDWAKRYFESAKEWQRKTMQKAQAKKNQPKNKST